MTTVAIIEALSRVLRPEDTVYARSLRDLAEQEDRGPSRDHA